MELEKDLGVFAIIMLILDTEHTKNLPSMYALTTHSVAPP